MKELTIEEKAKAYDEAKLRMSAAYNSNRCTIGFMNEIFPELKESEGERIRKAIIEFFELQDDNTTYSFVPKKDILAWLEKQGEQKPAWSEEDEYQINTILHGLDLKRELYKKEGNKVEEDRYNTQYNWLKSLKDRVQPQPNQEWSEEDKKMLKKSIKLFDEFGGDRKSGAYTLQEMDCRNCADWLKSLRPQNRWKPSDEQMKALAEALSLAKNCGEEWAFDIRTLLDALKKLREK